MKTRRRFLARVSFLTCLPLFAGTPPLLFGVPPASAQMHHVDGPQRVTRAVGVYEWTGDLAKPTAARFVPVSLFIEGHFEDAGLYLARPVPFALQPGDVYSLERSGEPQGVLDLELAHRVVTGRALADDNTLGAWYAFGRFIPAPPPKAAPLKPSSHLSALEQSAGPNTPAGAKLPTDEGKDSRPHMARRDGGDATAGPASGGSTSGTGGTPSNSGASGAGTSDDDTDRPTLRRRDPSQDAARRRDAGGRSKTASVTAAGPALGDDPDRPILGHNTADTSSTPELTGLPANLHQAVAVSDAAYDDNHPFARPWESPTERADTLAAMAALARTRLLEYMAANQLVASSASLPAVGASTDAAPPTDSHSSDAATGPKLYDTTTDVPAPPKLKRGIPAQSQGDANAKQGSSPPSRTNAASGSTQASSTANNSAASTSAGHAASPAHTGTHPARTSSHTASSRPATLTLAQEEISGFVLSYDGLPTFVFSAAASVKRTGLPAVPAKAGSSPALPAPTTASAPAAAFITVVAQRLASGELQVALSAATDSAHLDRGPRLRLVDAVDPDDSHRASLLFELRGGGSRQFALYRLTSAHAEQTFTTASIE